MPLRSQPSTRIDEGDIFAGQQQMTGLMSMAIDSQSSPNKPSAAERSEELSERPSLAHNQGYYSQNTPTHPWRRRLLT